MQSTKTLPAMLVALFVAAPAPLLAQQDDTGSNAVVAEEVAPAPAVEGESLGQKLDNIVDKTVETSGEAWEKSKEVSGQAWQKTKEVSGEVWEKTKSVTSGAVDATTDAASRAGAAAKSGYEAARETYSKSGEDAATGDEDQAAEAAAQ